MKRLCLITTLFLGISLNTKAPNLHSEFLQFRFETTVNKILTEIALQERIDRLLKTIRIIETRENYQLKGKSREYGAYQFTPATWRWYCKMFFNETLDITVPENQDKVARAKLEMLVRNGFTDEEIASFWNSGRKEWEGRVGINKYGVKYNVPKYVREFIKIKNNLV